MLNKVELLCNLIDDKRISQMANGLRDVSKLDDPVGEIIEGKVLENGLEISKKRVPLGVIAIIYESRPNVTTDAFGLCFKTGNAVILRGGSDAINTNIAISKIIKNLNAIVFAIMNYLLALILNIIHTNKLDVFTQTSVYGNKEAQALIELSSTIFLIWIFFLVIYKMIMMYQRKINPIDAYRVEKVIVEKRKRILPSNIREIRATEVVKLGTRERILPENIKEIRSPKYVKSLPTEVKQQRILPSNIREIKPLELARIETQPVEEKPIAKRILPSNIREIKSPKFVKELPKVKEEKPVINQVIEEQVIAPVVEEKPIVKPIRRTNSSLQELDLLLSASYDNYTIDDYKALKEMLMKKKAANQQRITRNNIEAKKYQQLKEIYESAN